MVENPMHKGLALTLKIILTLLKDPPKERIAKFKEWDIPVTPKILGILWDDDKLTLMATSLDYLLRFPEAALVAFTNTLDLVFKKSPKVVTDLDELALELGMDQERVRYFLGIWEDLNELIMEIAKGPLMIDIAVGQLLEEASKKDKEREKESNIIVAVYCTVCFLVVLIAVLIGIFSGGLL